MCFGKVVNAVQSSGDLEVFLISAKECDPLTAANVYPSFAGSMVQITEDLDAARASIAALKLDALVYLDIGMDPFSYQLAFSRLAQVQCVMAGHPSTTGIPTLDYFLSTADIEPEDAQQHYTEKLILMHKGTTDFTTPDLPTSWKTREELGMPSKGNLYLCPVMLQKIHPDFDVAVEGILRSDRNAHVVFVESAFAVPWTEILSRRFDRTISAEVRDRAIFVPWFTSTPDFLAALRISDVVLDPFHFGIGTTTLHLSAVGAPFVTFPGEFSRGRCGYALCKTLEIEECIASTPSDYVAKAVGVATSPLLRNEIHGKMLANSHRIFGDKGAAASLAATLLALINQS
jgi:predicted O-linked N-acetylglucosamine transferase (SPINDLY family)